MNILKTNSYYIKTTGFKAVIFKSLSYRTDFTFLLQLIKVNIPNILGTPPLTTKN